MTDPISPERLAEIQACERETRNGPWILADANDGDGTPPMWVVATSEAEDEDCDWAVHIHVGDKGVGEFIAMARTAVPELLAEVDRLTPRQITDIDEIEAFPVGTILLEHIAQHLGEAMAWRKERDGYWFPSTFSWVRQRGALAMAGAKPLLIHMPTPAAVPTAEGDPA